MLSMPAKLAPVVAVEDSPAICKSLIEEQVIEALDEIAKWLDEEPNESDSRAESGSSPGVETTIDDDGESVG